MDAPSVDILLDVDREYRDKATAGSLPKIAPRRMNPEGKAWLPVLHTRYGPWHFTALFSNTERAHDLHRIFDWVVIFYSDPEGGEGRATVVTERRGALTGMRVVRGREPECARHYRGERISTREPSLSASDG
jgi:DNA polymerase (family X)